MSKCSAERISLKIEKEMSVGKHLAKNPKTQHSEIRRHSLVSNANFSAVALSFKTKHRWGRCSISSLTPSLRLCRVQPAPVTRACGLFLNPSAISGPLHLPFSVFRTLLHRLTASWLDLIGDPGHTAQILYHKSPTWPSAKGPCTYPR